VAQKALALRAPNFPIAEGARPPHRATKRFCCLGFSTWNTLIASSIANLVQTSRSLSSLTMDLTFAPVQFTRMFSVVSASSIPRVPLWAVFAAAESQSSTSGTSFGATVAL
jgi:hypothetical protein